jgi:hypothetical protein
MSASWADLVEAVGSGGFFKQDSHFAAASAAAKYCMVLIPVRLVIRWVLWYHDGTLRLMVCYSWRGLEEIK